MKRTLHMLHFVHAAQLALSVLALGAVVGCGPQHIRPHTERVRNYEVGDYGDRGVPVSEGSLWEEGGRGLFADFRAAAVGDVLTIQIDETPKAQGDASTNTDRETSNTMGAGGLFGFTAALQRAYPDLDPSRLIDLASESSFDASGQTSRGSRVRAAITVRVKKRLPNDDLYLEGSKILLVNDEELHIYISGVVRSQDIAQDNTVGSSRVADAQIEFTGRGILTNNQEQGWLSRILSAINPF